MFTTTSSSLRQLLIADAVISGATGIAMIVAAGAVEPLLNISAMVMRFAGLILIPFAVMVLAFSRPANLTASKAWAVIALNFAWVVASILALTAGWIQPTALGIAFVLFQAIVVAVLAELQVVGVRRSFTVA